MVALAQTIQTGSAPRRSVLIACVVYPRFFFCHQQQKKNEKECRSRRSLLKISLAYARSKECTLQARWNHLQILISSFVLVQFKFASTTHKLPKTNPTKLLLSGIGFHPAATAGQSERGFLRGKHLLKCFPLKRHSFAYFSTAVGRKVSRGTNCITISTA